MSYSLIVEDLNLAKFLFIILHHLFPSFFFSFINGKGKRICEELLLQFKQTKQCTLGKKIRVIK